MSKFIDVDAHSKGWAFIMKKCGFKPLVRVITVIRVRVCIVELHQFHCTNEEGTCKTPYGIIHYYFGMDNSYQTLDGYRLYSDFKYDVPAGKYLLSIKGYARKQALERPNSNYGFFFSLKEVDEFHGFKNPREEFYDFNVAHM